jgi:hypothetical protein
MCVLIVSSAQRMSTRGSADFYIPFLNQFAPFFMRGRRIHYRDIGCFSSHAIGTSQGRSRCAKSPFVLSPVFIDNECRLTLAFCSEFRAITLARSAPFQTRLRSVTLFPARRRASPLSPIWIVSATFRISHTIIATPMSCNHPAGASRVSCLRSARNTRSHCSSFACEKCVRFHVNVVCVF